MFQKQTVGAVGLVGVNVNRTDILEKDRRREPARVLEVLVEQDQLLMSAQTVPSLVSKLSKKIKTISKDERISLNRNGVPDAEQESELSSKSHKPLHIMSNFKGQVLTSF